MNSSYNDFFNQLIVQQDEKQDVYDLKCLIEVFNKVDIYNIVYNVELVDFFYEKLSDSLSFVIIAKNNPTFISKITFDEIEIFKKVIKAISLNIQNLPEDILDLTRLIASIFLVVGYIKADFNIWSYLNIQKARSDKLIATLIEILSKFDLIKSIQDKSINIYANELLYSYEEGLNEINLIKIYQFIDAFEKSVIVNNINFIFIQEAVSFLLWADFNKLLHIFEQKTDLLSIYYLLEGLSIDEKLSICLKVNNSLTMIECIREVIKPLKDNLSQQQVDMLSECLLKLANNPNGLWKNFLSYFNIYPSRYPLLHKPMGKALSLVSDECLIEYVNSIIVNKFESGNRYINECLETFFDYSPQKRILFILDSIFLTWDNFMNDYMNNCMNIDFNSDLLISNIIKTNIFDFVLNYFCYRINESQLLKEIGQTVEKLSSINSKWFYYKISQVSYFHILLSKLYVYSTAWEKCGYFLQRDSHLANQLEQLLKNKYLFKLQNLSPETMKQIDIIRNNFSLAQNW